jgi:hypothetical protein
MIDLETLNTTPDSAILTIGAAKSRWRKKLQEQALPKKLY